MNNIRKNGKISVIIGARAGSIRCKEKNFRNFGDTNLLIKKIKQIKLVKEIDEIIVSTNSEIMLKMARDLGVKAIKRDPYYCRSETTTNELYEVFAKTVNNPIMISVTCVSPFSKNKDLIKMIKIFREDKTHTSVISGQLIKKHLYMNGKPYNFDKNHIPKSQDLPPLCIPTYSFNIIETELALKERTTIGKNPYFYIFNEINAIDIDTPLDFVISELLYKNNITTEEDINNYLNK